MSALAVGASGGGSMSATLNGLLEKTSNWDKDERYMATNDLCNELQKDIKVSDGSSFCGTPFAKASIPRQGVRMYIYTPVYIFSYIL